MSVILKNVSKTYGTQKAVHSISFEVSKGEIVGFIGPNGAGKSTTMKIITGFLSSFEGSVEVLGMDVRTQILDIKKRIGYLPEHNPLYVDMYIHEYLQFIAGVYNITKNKKQTVSDIIELTGLTKEQNKKIGSLSKGYKQRVGLASVLLHNPDVLILDEPTTGLDPNQIIEIRNIIAQVGKEKTVILSTHIMQEVEAICNKVIIINNGVIVANDSSADIKKQVNSDNATIIVEFLQETNIEILKTIPLVEQVIHIQNKTWLIKPSNAADIREIIFNFAVENSLTVLSMQMQEKTLEQAFHDLTKK